MAKQWRKTLEMEVDFLFIVDVKLMTHCNPFVQLLCSASVVTLQF